MSRAPRQAVVVHCPDSYRPEREYAIDVVMSTFLRLPHEVAFGELPEVEVAVQGEPKRLALADVLFGTPAADWLTAAAVPELPLRHWRLESELPDQAAPDPLPVLFGDRDAKGGYLEETDSGLRLGIDILGSIFFLLTRYEELATAERDAHGRFPWPISLAHRAGFLERPLANEYADLLFGLMRRLWPRLERPSRRPRLLLSHDVDFPFSGRQPLRHVLRSTAADVVKRHEPGLALRRLSAYARQPAADAPERDPAFTFGFILDENERHGVRCWVNLMTETHGFGSVPYSLDEPWARSLLRKIGEGGHHVGFHPSYGTYRDLAQLRTQLTLLKTAAEREGVDQEEWGGRQHWLQWENPTTWQLWEDAGLQFDSSLGYDVVPGFRCSTCYPYPAFNLITRARLKLEERPLSWMDVTYMGFLRLSPEDAVARALELYARCRLHDGDFTVLWHNDSLISKRQRAAYVELLDGLA